MVFKRLSFFCLPANPLLRLLAINGAIGVAIAIVLLAGVFWTNTGHLRDLVEHAENPVLPVVMLAVGLIITIGSVVMGSAIMLLPSDDRRPGSGKGTAWIAPRSHGDLVPIRVTVRARSRERNIR